MQKNSTSTQDHIATLKFKTADTPFEFQGENLVIDNHSYVLHTHFTSLSNIIVAVLSNYYGGDSRNGGKVLVPPEYETHLHYHRT